MTIPSPSPSRTSSYDSLSSIFSDPASSLSTDYVIVPQSAASLRAELDSLAFWTDDQGCWKSIAAEICNALCDQEYKLNPATFMQAYHAVFRIGTEGKAFGEDGINPNIHLRQNLTTLLTTYLSSLHSISADLDPSSRSEFLRERKARYTQTAIYASYLFRYQDRHWLVRENEWRGKGEREREGGGAGGDVNRNDVGYGGGSRTGNGSGNGSGGGGKKMPLARVEEVFWVLWRRSGLGGIAGEEGEREGKGEGEGTGLEEMLEGLEVEP
ncbi:hypothetical protein MMC10_006531 [Thelotrema lepadinum]|nr:hypothetical protein [Thelotrema lepadinum]